MFNTSPCQKCLETWTHNASAQDSTQRPQMKDWRLISILLTCYNMFVSTLQASLMPWTVDTTRLFLRQKSSLPQNGLQEHNIFYFTTCSVWLSTHQLKTVYNVCGHQRHIRKSVDRAFVVQYIYSISDWSVALIKDAYRQNGLNFHVKPMRKLKKKNIVRQRSITQGWLISFIAFSKPLTCGLDGLNANTPTPMSHAQYNCKATRMIF